MQFSNTVTYTWDPAEWKILFRDEQGNLIDDSAHGTEQENGEITSRHESEQEGLSPITAWSLPPLPDAD